MYQRKIKKSKNAFIFRKQVIEYFKIVTGQENIHDILLHEFDELNSIEELDSTLTDSSIQDSNLSDEDRKNND